MKFIKEFSSWNPVVNLEVTNFINKNKGYLMHLWDDEKSEEEEENSLFGPDEETETETDKDYILPKNLTTLTFGDNFNQNVDNLPPNLQTLTFGYQFNQNVDNLPSNIEYIKLPRKI